MTSIILIGFGGVGRALIEILVKDKPLLTKDYSFQPIVTAICELKGAVVNPNGIDLNKLLSVDQLSDFPDWQPNLNFKDIIGKIPADIIVECTWTNPKTGEPALSHIQLALHHKKHVVSSNKGPFYLKYHEIKALADKNNVMLGFGATVGSAIPCIATRRTLAGSNVVKIQAILNGTSNYILSRMTTENLSFDLALKEAQTLGYAEKDPSLDIEGYDAAGKLVILANTVLGWNKTIHDVKISGISYITPEVIQLAKKDGYYLKHLAIAEENQLWLGLKLVPMDSPLAVNGSLNVIEFDTENAGPILMIGRGAGRKEAASGIIADLIYITNSNKL
jgi:homoserine dehydrogenase